MKIRLRKLGTGSVFLLALVIYGTAGLLVGGLVAVAATVPLPEGYEVTLLDQLGPWALAVFPVVYGLAGGLFAAMAAVLYNLAAAVTGGITVELSGLEGLEATAADGSDQPEGAAASEDPDPSSSSSGE